MTQLEALRNILSDEDIGFCCDQKGKTAWNDICCTGRKTVSDVSPEKQCGCKNAGTVINIGLIG